MTSTNTTAAPATIQAVRMTNSQLEYIQLDAAHTDTAISAAIDCRMFDVVSCDHSIDIWVDDEGAINGSEFNLRLTIAAHALGVRAALFGNGVLTGSNDATGETVALTATQLALITEALGNKPSPALVDQLADTLAPLPGVVAFLRSL